MGKKIYKLNIFLSLFLLLLLMLILCGCDVKSTVEKWVPFYPNYVYHNDSPSVAVSIAECDGIVFSGERQLRVPIGGELSIPMTLKEGYCLEELPEGYTYADGVLKIEAVNYPTTISLKTEKLDRYSFYAYSNDPSLGHIETNMAMGMLYGGASVSVSARSVSDDVEFIGFSLDKSIDNGGTIIAPGKDYSFLLDSNTVIYANFQKTKDVKPTEPNDEFDIPEPDVSVSPTNWAILYNPNGGIDTRTGNGGTRTTYFSKKFYLCPNAMPNEGQFTRDGYVLIGYNTRADGKGTYYAPGWNIVMPEGYKAIELYCMWQKESNISDFTYTLQGSSATITGYNGNDDFIVIPEKIKNSFVTAISAKAFKDLDAHSIYIPRKVTRITSNIISNCVNLTTLYIGDSVTAMQDNSIISCPKLEKLYVMATRYPAYSSQRNGTYAIKFEKLITDKGRKLVLTGASNAAYGFNSSLLENLMKDAGYDFSVINYGNNQATTALFYFEVISHFVNDEDIVLHAAEPVASQWGTVNEFDPVLWQIFEGAYDAFSYVDIRNYSKVFSSFADHNRARASLPSRSNGYELYSTVETVNKYGDYDQYKKGTLSSFAAKVSSYINSSVGGNIDLSEAAEYIKEGSVKLNHMLDKITKAGGDVLISFSAIMKPALTYGSQSASGDEYEKYIKAIDDMVNGTRISEQSTYILEYKLFYNSEYHLNSEGADLRTQKTADDIIKYLDGKAE